MARIKPFKGIRPPKDLIEQVASRPYDVLNSEEAREEAKGNEKSLKGLLQDMQQKYHYIISSNRRSTFRSGRMNTILPFI